METATALVDFAEIYGWIGLSVAIPFLLFGMDRFDEDARGAYMYRPLLLPGVVLIWPLVLWRWVVVETGRDKWPLRHRPPRKAHGIAALALAVCIPAIIITGIAIKQVWPADVAPQQLEAPE
ncbi:MAG: hypothetical protein P8I56_18660 [Paracoccaceae bacterium]|jgi:hypothetical protein|nr:hypothetical protein [Paracoccaceae bacterium]MDG1370316.1 hypothetical protein [Paracoccaceae bacterium]MDG1972966.1 hypothetical protein [Paracoccaceae bacterium]